jgi:hypothetical protein
MLARDGDLTYCPTGHEHHTSDHKGPVQAPPFFMTDTNLLSSSLSVQPEVQGVKTLVGENITNDQELAISNGIVQKDQSGSVAQATPTLTSDHHPSDAWEQDTTSSPRLQVVDEKQEFT